jgi:hypothetical protein
MSESELELHTVSQYRPIGWHPQGSWVRPSSRKPEVLSFAHGQGQGTPRGKRQDLTPILSARAQVALNGFHNDVEVVAHEAVGMATPIEAVTNLPQQRQPLPAISIFQVNDLPAITARGDMKQAPGNSMRKGRAIGRL